MISGKKNSQNAVKRKNCPLLRRSQSYVSFLEFYTLILTNCTSVFRTFTSQTDRCYRLMELKQNLSVHSQLETYFSSTEKSVDQDGGSNVPG